MSCNPFVYSLPLWYIVRMSGIMKNILEISLHTPGVMFCGFQLETNCEL